MVAKLGFVALTWLSAAVAWAQPPPDEAPRGPRGGLPPMPLMMALDADGDGILSPREIKKAVSALKTLDQDGDGRLTEDELRPQFPGGGRPDEGGGPAGQFGPGGPTGPGGQGGPGGFGGPPSAEMFVSRALQFDADQDGKLSKEELTKMAEQLGRGMGRGPGGAGGPGAGGGPGGIGGPGPAGGGGPGARRPRGAPKAE